MTTRFPILTLVLAVTASVAGCDRSPPETAANAATPTPQSSPRTLTLVESELPTPIRFQAGDVDPSKDPCVDFDGYINSRWLAANPIPGDRSSWGPFETLNERSLAIRRQLAEQAAKAPQAQGIEKIIGDLWATGMDEAKIDAQGLEPLRSRLAEIDALKTPDNIAAHLRTTAARGELGLFDFEPEVDFKDPNIQIAYASQAGLGLPDKGYYFDKDKQDKLQAYQAHVAKVLELGGAQASVAATQAQAVIDFETRLAKASRSREELARDVELYYNPITPAAADKLTPRFSWTKFFTEQGVTPPTMFSLAMPAFHQEMDKLIAEAPVASWQAYLRFHLINSASPYLAAPFATENFNFYRKTLLGQKVVAARWKRVLGAIEGGAGEAMGELYVKVAFPPESKQRMEALVGTLGSALKTRLENLTWMSDKTKQQALAKWATFVPKIGYPDKWRDWSGLVTNRDSYLGNVFAAQTFNYKYELGKIGKPVDKSEWEMTPQTVNAYYNPQRNEIVFPAAILQPPFFSPDADEATNFGSIGAVIGHEMTHGYDDQGSRFGPSGAFENWWTEADAKGFAARSKQLIEQFNDYEALPGVRVNGNLTLGENIADLGGLATAYDAMRLATAGKPDPKTDGLTRDQRFFASFATTWRQQKTPDYTKLLINTDTHSPARFRANGAVANLPAFATAFACKAGQPMVRGEKRVAIW